MIRQREGHVILCHSCHRSGVTGGGSITFATEVNGVMTPLKVYVCRPCFKIVLDVVGGILNVEDPAVRAHLDAVRAEAERTREVIERARANSMANVGRVAPTAPLSLGRRPGPQAPKP